MPDSEFEDVMAALRDGQQFQIGGGRIFPVYAMRAGQVIVIWSDDGYREERPCDEQTLRTAIAEAPHCFREIIAWRNEQPRDAATPQPSWPPTPSPPTSIAEAEATLRAGALGPPPFGDDDPWDFILRWPDDVVATWVWPAVSNLLADAGPEVRERAIAFAKRWPLERPRSLERLIEVATQHTALYRDANQLETLALGLADLACAVRSEQPRVADLILTLFGDAPPCRGGVSLVAEHEPYRLIQRAPRWTDSLIDQLAAQAAATAVALYRPDHLLDLLAALRSRSEPHRIEILAALGSPLGITDEHRAVICNTEGIPLPQRPCPTTGDCSRALGLE